MIQVFWRGTWGNLRQGIERFNSKAVGKDTTWNTLPNPCLFALEPIQAIPLPIFQPTPPIRISHLPDKLAWRTLVHYCLEHIQKQHLEKIVLARKTTLQFEKKIDPLQVLDHLQKRHSATATVFCIRFDAERTFLGATPEKLFLRKGSAISCDAIAGTRPKARGHELWDSKKDRKEFDLVKHFVNDRLQPLCTTGGFASKDTLLDAGFVQHLSNCFNGQLKDGVSDKLLLQQLHPTPAVGGWPQDAALELIEEVELFDRGWYASPFGLTNGESTEAAIGIRSALIDGNCMHLFAGAGIVEGSDPDQEWDELESKTALFRSFLC